MAVYLDYNATAPLLDCARDAWLACQGGTWGNASSTHIFGQQAQNAFDAAKKRIAVCMSCKAHELVVCGSGTEANALAIHSALHSTIHSTIHSTMHSTMYERADTNANAQILCGAAEHSSILRNAEEQGAVKGSVQVPVQMRVQRVAVDANACMDADALAAALSENTALVCFQYANNEVGSLQDIDGLAQIIRSYNPDIHIHVDACQGTGKNPIACGQLDVDSVSFTGHKFGAPKGSGLLYVRAGVKIAALIRGGQQQQDRRSGTEDIAAVCAVAAALEWSLAHCAAEGERQRQLLADTWDCISTALPEVQWLAQHAARLPGTMSLAHPGVKSSALIPRLDLAGFALSPGSACMAARGDSSHVILAMGIAPSLAKSVIRVSIGAGISSDDMAAFAQAYIAEVQSLRNL